ncbi:hypothetical protein OC835_001039 [Tilletia horrida]|nr:hypothetical protein OC835_001039 [Tilletia horrida]
MAHRVPERSPLTGKSVPSHFLHASDAFFRDTAGRAVLLRGVNLSGSSKAPVDKPSQEAQGFWDDAEAGGRSFVGRPLDLNDGSADVHLARLKSWGFNSFRYVFTWEALEHEGPGKYDHAFIQYTVDVLRKIKQYGFRVYMDPHQDLFSRFTGGSGAPYWVLPACGMNPRNFTPTQAALIHSEWPSQEDPSPIDYPDMIWATNYTRLAAATLSVLFFAGRDFAPKCIIDNQNIQDWLQSHFINAVKQLAKAVASADGGDLLESCVVGWDSMNEPNPTYIGLSALNKLPAHWKLRKGPMPTPLQSFITGIGKAQEIENYVFGPVGPKRQGSVVVDPKGKSIWMSPLEDEQKGGSRWGWARHPDWPLGRCLWAAHGVWNEETNELLDSAYFSKFGGPSGTRPVDFIEDYWLPHWRAYSSAIRPIHPEAIMFMQPPVFEPPPKGLTEADLKQRACVSCHFYDGLTLITKHWNWFNADAVGLVRGKYLGVPFALRVGYKAIRQCMRDQLGYLRADTLDVLGQYPTIIGEIGIPFDLDKRKAYYGDAKGNGKGDFSAQTTALDASINACDGTNLLSYSLWTYCPDNTHKWGDGWNGEDLSLWGLDDIKQISSSSQLSATMDRNTTSRSGPSSSSNVNLLSAPDKMGQLSESTTSLGAVVEGVRDGGRSPTFKLDFSNGISSASSSSPPAQGLPALSNGARSAAAFVRPYPVACNGVPVEINFDIKSSEFTFTLEVDERDLAEQPSDVKIAYGRAGEGLDAGGRARGVLPTEIFLPFIHYAKDGSAASAMGNFDSGRINRRAGQTGEQQGDRQRQVTDSGSGSSSSASSTAGLVVAPAGLSPLMTASAPVNAEKEPRIEYDVEVEVSAGSWEIRGQYLYWSLPPSAGDADEVRKVLEEAEAAAMAAENSSSSSDEGRSNRSKNRARNSQASSRSQARGRGRNSTCVRDGEARGDETVAAGEEASSYPLSRTGSISGSGPGLGPDRGASDAKRGPTADVVVGVHDVEPEEELDEDSPDSQSADEGEEAGRSTGNGHSGSCGAIPALLPTVTEDGKVRHHIRIVRRTGAVRSTSSSFLMGRRRRGMMMLLPQSLRRRRRISVLIVVVLGLFMLAALALLVVLLATLHPR